MAVNLVEDISRSRNIGLRLIECSLGVLHEVLRARFMVAFGFTHLKKGDSPNLSGYNLEISVVKLRHTRISVQQSRRSNVSFTLIADGSEFA